MAAAASLAAEAAAWRKRDFSSSSSAFWNAVAVWWWQHVGGSSMACADNNFNRHDDNDDWLLIVPLLQGRGEGWVRGLAACIAGGHCDGRWWQLQWWLFEQKRGWTRKKERRNWKMGLFFSCCLFLLLFFGLSLSMQVSWFLPLLLHAAVTIMVKKRLVNSIIYFYIL
jgi:hypothetical protein